jgi:predicted O-methyltransferase YrrM
MKLTLRIGSVILGIILLVGLQTLGFGQEHPTSHTLAKTSGEKAIMDVLNRMVTNQETYLSVPEQDGRALRLLTEAVGAHRVLEIGTSTGYSGLWFSMALQATGGHLTTLEFDHGRATQARQHFEQAGVSSLITVIEGDAHEQVTKLKGPFDVAFIDAEKPGYLDYLHKVLPLVRPGGLIFAHNVDMVPDYVKAITSSPDLETIFYMEGKGLAITLKKP